MDTTLRDGEQTSGVSFTPEEKLTLAKVLLNELHVPRIEIASARVSSGEYESVKRVCDWASDKGVLGAIEILGFIDKGISLKWISEVGAKVVNMLAKGSEKHCISQLKKTREEHVADIREEVVRATEMGISVNLYLEDWSNGIKNSPDYVFYLIDNLKDLPIKRFLLPDTLGIFNPQQVLKYGGMMIERYPDIHFDFHGHNDYDLATANSFAAISVGFRGVHCTVNGLGERAGNTTLSSLVAVMHDMAKVETGIDESKIVKVSAIVESFSAIPVPQNKPIIGENVFTQCAGVHADGDSKDKLYFNDLLPERFGREREYALGKTSGKANVRNNLEALGIELSEEQIRKVTERIIKLGDKKEIVTQSDLPYIVADVIKHDESKRNVHVINYALNLSCGLRPTATIKMEINGAVYQQSAVGDGQYDAFMKAVKRIYNDQLNRKFPMLTNYTVNIPPGGRTDALVQATITWEHKGHQIKTRGLDADQMEAAIQATIKMLNIIETLN